MSALPEITACSVSPAPLVPKFSSTMPCFLKMSVPSNVIWFSQVVSWPTAIFSVSSARAGVVIDSTAKANAQTIALMRIS
jgi:hypothetical protein